MSENYKERMSGKKIQRANVWNYNMLLSNISASQFHLFFCKSFWGHSTEIFRVTRPRNIVDDTTTIILRNIFANMNAAFKQSRPSFWPKWHFSWRGLEPGPGEGEMPSIEMPCMQLCIQPPASHWLGSCYFEIIAHLGQKNAHTWPKPFILDRSPLMRNWAKARINFALQLMAIREILNASYNLQ